MRMCSRLSWCKSKITSSLRAAQASTFRVRTHASSPRDLSFSNRPAHQHTTIINYAFHLILEVICPSMVLPHGIIFCVRVFYSLPFTPTIYNICKRMYKVCVCNEIWQSASLYSSGSYISPSQSAFCYSHRTFCLQYALYLKSKCCVIK